MGNRVRYAWAACFVAIVVVAIGLFGMRTFSADSVAPLAADEAPLAVSDRARNANANDVLAAPDESRGVPALTRYEGGPSPALEVIAGDDGEERMSHQVIVSAPVADAYELAHLSQASGVACTEVETIATDLFEGETQYVLTYEGDASPEEAGECLVAAGVVSLSEPNYVSHLAAEGAPIEVDEAPAKEGASALASTGINDHYAKRQWQLGASRAFAAWDIAKTNGAVTVVVIDSGVDYEHPDLADNLILDYARNTAEGEDGAEAVRDYSGHGTFVAGIIAAVPNNEIGVAGASYNAKILPIKACSGETETVTNAAIIAGITYVTSLKKSAVTPELANIRVINLSLGSSSKLSTNYMRSLTQANEAGILVVAAAGNSNGKPVEYPAALDDVVGVSALAETTAGGYDLAYYSNYGPELSVAAPGSSVYSTVKGSTYGLWSGTSFATPMVSGAAALMFAMDPDATPAQVKGIIEETACDIGPEGKDDKFGYGMLDMGAAALRMLENQYGDVVAPTCTEEGSYERPGEDGTETVVIPALGHTTVTEDEVYATCTTPGRTMREYCRVCGVVTIEAEEIEARGHDYSITEVPPTCTEPGVKVFVCSWADEAHTEPGADALGHLWGEWEITSEPTYTAAGSKIRTCERCDVPETETIPRLKTDIERFVDRLYANVLGREADEPGEIVQVNEIKRVGAAEVVFNFFDSDEYKDNALRMTNEEQVRLVYRTLLDRDADPEGLKLWRGYLDNGMSAEALVAGFAESKEFRDLCASFNVSAGSADFLRAYRLEPRDKNPGVTAFASRLYTIVLGRTNRLDVEGGIDVAGLNAQCEGLINGIACWGIAYNFFGSAEFTSKKYDEAKIVEIAYAALLGRCEADIAGDVAGRAYWEKRLETNGMLDMVMGFCESKEFEDICQSCGMTSGMH